MANVYISFTGEHKTGKSMLKTCFAVKLREAGFKVEADENHNLTVIDPVETLKKKTPGKYILDPDTLTE